ncbi:Integrase catalytic domain-containing protein [Favolaschia claudopus]|uniref:Integrase catalytic domain-containing protein n=1 Tax=Favolaschia claudopus TaxID=2862362 RepID=A0AAV9ZH91_9AGAR
MSTENQPGSEDTTHAFLSQADKIIRESRFIVESLPNAEISAVKRAIRQLNAVHHVFANLQDAWLDEADIARCLTFVLEINPPPPRNVGTTTVRGSGAGRPRYVLDLAHACELHDLGNSWEGIAEALGVQRRTLYYHLCRAGLSSSRRAYTEISDDALDEYVAEISLHHPLAGSAILMGHLEAKGIHVSSERVQDSLWRVDGIGVIVRWSGVIKRRVYRVRGANALWHHDGNEKLRPWGFYRSATVEALWMEAVSKYGWPSRGRGDFGKENNGVERRMIAHWGVMHRAYLRGRSTQNIRMERNWRDVRKDTLEFFRQIFFYLEESALLDMENPIHRICLYIVFQPRIQHSLDETRSSWNLHKIRTAGNKTPTAIYELSKTRAINRGYWNSDPGDDIPTASNPTYGEDPEEQLPPADELSGDHVAADHTEFPDAAAERDGGVFVNADDEIRAAAELLSELNLAEDDGNWGVDLYCRAVRIGLRPNSTCTPTSLITAIKSPLILSFIAVVDR